MTFRLGYAILHHEFSDLTNACIESLMQHAPGVQVVVLDNGSPTPFHWHGRTLRVPNNVCLAKAMNKVTDAMFSSADLDAVVQLNNDIVITSTTHDQLVWAFQGSPRLGIAAPMMDQEDAGYMYQACPEEPGPRAEAYLSGHLPRESLEIVPFVDNAAFTIRRRTWEEVGGLEERFSGASWGANYDYCWRARIAGWETGLIRSAFVFHRHSATWSQLDPDYPSHAAQQMMREMRQVWGDMADKVSHREIVRRWRAQCEPGGPDMVSGESGTGNG